MKRINKTILVIISVISFFGMNEIGVNAEWKQDSNGWWYADNNSWYTG
jgi:hypothetical protein